MERRVRVAWTRMAMVIRMVERLLLVVWRLSVKQVPSGKQRRFNSFLDQTGKFKLPLRGAS